MLLGEPTNHLDLPMLDWLENTIAEMEETALVVVSHDRYFLDSVVDEIFDMVDGRIGAIRRQLLRLLPSLRPTAKCPRPIAPYSQQQAFIAKEEEYIRRFGGWPSARPPRPVAAKSASTASRPAAETRASSAPPRSSAASAAMANA